MRSANKCDGQLGGLLERYSEWVTLHPKTVVVLGLLLTGVLGALMGSLKIDTDPSLWAPQTHPFVQTTNLIEDVFGGRNIMLIGVAPKTGDIYQPAVLGKILRIQAAIEQLPQAVRHNILSLAARKAKKIRGTRDGMEVRRLLEEVPRSPKDIAELRAAVSSLPIYINSLVSADGKAAAIIADFKLDKSDPSYAAIYEAVRPIVDRERDASVDIYMGGMVVSDAWFEYHMLKMPIYFGVALLVIMGIQFWSFRSLQGMFLPTVTAILSVVWALGLMGLLGIHMDPLNTTTPILIMAIAAGHAIQILKRYYEEYRRLLQAGAAPGRASSRQAVVESMVRVGPVMIIAGTIAALTFYSLSLTGIVAVKHFGIFAGSGVLGALLLEMSMIPAIRTLLRPPKPNETYRQRGGGILDRTLNAIADVLTGNGAKRVLFGGFLALVIAIGGLAKLSVDNDIKSYHRPDSEYRVQDDFLNKTFGGTSSAIFLVEAPEPDGIKDPKILAGIERLQSFLDAQPNVGKTQSLVDLIKRMNQAMHSDDKSYYRLPSRKDLVAQYLFLYSLSGDPQDFDTFVDNDYRLATIWTYLKVDNSTYLNELYQKAKGVIAESFPPGVKVKLGGSLPENIALNDVVTADKTKNMMQMAIVVFVLATVMLRSWLGGIFVTMPLLAVILANLGLMGWVGIPLDMTSATTAAMAIGIGADYEIYLLYRFREELARTENTLAATRAALLTTGKGILFVALSVIGGYMALQVSDFAFYSSLSSMVITTIVVSTLFALVFLRAVMLLVKPDFLFGGHVKTNVMRSVAVEGEKE